MDELGDFFKEVGAAVKEVGAFVIQGVVVLTGAAGLADNAINQPDVDSLRFQQNGESIKNMSEDNLIRKNDDDSDLPDFISGGGGGGDGDDPDYNYNPPELGSTLQEPSTGWSLFGYSGVSEDYRVDTSSDYSGSSDSDSSYSSDYSDSSSDYSGGSDSDSSDSSDYSDSSSDYSGGSDSDSGSSSDGSSWW